jgi:hypothetical protein
VDIEEANVGDRIDKSPAEKEDERVWVCRCLGDLRGGDAGLSEFNEDVMSILPPPMTPRLSNADRREFRDFAWSDRSAGVVGVRRREPDNWA